MAAAQAAGILALGQLWWDDTFTGAPNATGAALVGEIVRQASWLSKTWDAASSQVLVGVGDQLNDAGGLLAYEDFGPAHTALAAGPPPASNRFGQPTSVAPECTFSTPAVSYTHLTLPTKA